MSGYTRRIPKIYHTTHRCPDWDGLLICCDDDEYECCTCPQYNGKRGWLYLTDDEILDALGALEAEEAVFRVARAVESKLKEKNT